MGIMPWRDGAGHGLRNGARMRVSGLSAPRPGSPKLKQKLTSRPGSRQQTNVTFKLGNEERLVKGPFRGEGRVQRNHKA